MIAMPMRIMMGVAHTIMDRALSTTERVLIPKGKLRELERRRVDRIIKELYDEIYGRDRDERD
jgi:hypothetical protein